MKKLGQEREVIQLAASLHVDWRQNAVENIMALCHSKIANWLFERPGISSMRELEELVCRKLKLVFEMVWTDEDLRQIIRRYVNLGEPIFSTLKADLDEKTFATLIERRKITGASKDRYVAVVDCRGDKASRRFFTRWHEIAHLLTLQGQLELPLHRSGPDKSPTERLMDTIAGEVGFYGPFFAPVLAEEVEKEGRLNFSVVERVRQRFCPEASFHATLNACINRLGSAAMVLEVGLGYKRSEQKEINSCQQQLLPRPLPMPKLRVLSSSRNKWARTTPLRVHVNMRVPASSIIYKLFFENQATRTSDLRATEWLGIWRHSDGTSLGNLRVSVEARRLPDSVLVLILPAELHGRQLSSVNSRPD